MLQKSSQAEWSCFTLIHRNQKAGSAYALVCKVPNILKRDVGCKVGLKLKLSLFLAGSHDARMYGGVDVWLHALLALVLDGGEWSTSHPGHFTPWFPLRGRLDGPQDSVWMWWRKKNEAFHCPCQESNPGRPASSLVTILTELHGFLKWNVTKTNSLY